MGIRAIPRTAVDGALKLTRLPLDIAISLMPGNGSGVRPAAGIAVDRLDARLRDVAGVVLRDSALRDEAMQRRVAADERARAARLRNEAEAGSEAADARFSVRVEDAEERRATAEQRAENQRVAAERRKHQRTQAAASTEQKRKSASRRARAQVGEVIDEEADRARLEELKAKAEALEERERALVAQAEAQRLQDEATKKKAARKAR
jgi:hypothetical protein